MKYARIIHEGIPQNAAERDGQLMLDNAQLLPLDAVTWLPPLADTRQPRTIFAVALNYADGSKAPGFKAPDEPLVFLKSPSALAGHRQTTRRPADVQIMHPECELAVVIGKEAKHVKRGDAYDFIAGYTVANDYTVRDYLENWYRPNLRAKNRDGATPLGPWFVEKEDVADPMALALTTTVNGKLTQSGNTRDMVFDVPFLIEYLSSFMSLRPGDLILTGTPGGAIDCRPGDVVVTQIEGIGALENRIA